METIITAHAQRAIDIARQRIAARREAAADDKKALIAKLQASNEDLVAEPPQC